MMKGKLRRLKLLLVVLCSACLLFANLTAYADQIVTYVHTDRLGNPAMETDSTGAVIWRQSYTPYGETPEQADPDGPGFTGHRHDSETGLVYMQARYYDPIIGRFLSVDSVTFTPAHPQQFNRYWYAQGNPYRYTDPDGKDVVFGVDPNGASGNGHTTLYYQDKTGNWYAYNEGAAGDVKSSGNLGFILGQDAPAGVSITAISAADVPTDGLRIQTTPGQDAKIAASALSSAKAYNSGQLKYNLYSDNCTDAAVGVVNSSGAGITVKNPWYEPAPNKWIHDVKTDPNAVQNNQNGKGTSKSLRDPLEHWGERPHPKAGEPVIL